MAPLTNKKVAAATRKAMKSLRKSVPSEVDLIQVQLLLDLISNLIDEFDGDTYAEGWLGDTSSPVTVTATANMVALALEALTEDLPQDYLVIAHFLCTGIESVAAEAAWPSEDGSIIDEGGDAPAKVVRPYAKPKYPKKK